MTGSVSDRLHALGCAWRRARLAQSALGCLAATLALWLFWFWLDNLLRLPAGVRLAMAAVGLALPANGFWRRCLRPAVWRISPERTARALESRNGMDDNLLINACQFERQAWQGSPAATLAQQTVLAGAARAAEVVPQSLRDRPALRRLAFAATLAVACWLGYSLMLSRQAGNAWARFSRPLADIPPVAPVAITLAPAGTIDLWAGDALEVRATLRAFGSPHARPAGEPPVLRRGRQLRFGEAAVEQAMIPDRDNRGVYVWRAEDVRDSFTCRALCEGTWSPALHVRVRHPPRIVDSSFTVTPPAYRGGPTNAFSGPPSSLAAMSGSRVTVKLRFDRPLASLVWQQSSNLVAGGAVSAARQVWSLDLALDEAGDYQLLGSERAGDEPRALARGAVTLQPDAPPVVAIVAEDHNRLVWPGEQVTLEIEAGDDLGLRDVVVVVRRPGEVGAGTRLTAWPYGGPPGRGGFVRERLVFGVDAERFEPGESYQLEALARDWRPGAEAVHSMPLLLRVRRPREAVEALEGAARQAAEALEKTIAEQRRALGLSRNLEVHLDEALRLNHLDAHRGGMTRAQTQARIHGRTALQAMKNLPGAAPVARLDVLVEPEMGLALSGIGALTNASPRLLPPALTRLSERQTYILTELLALLGHLGASARLAADATAGAPPVPAPTTADRARDLRDLLKDFTAAQKRILDVSRSLLERGPDDLSEEEKEILGQLAREEARLAAILKDKLDDLSKNPLQDFADGALADEFNEVYQEVARAAASLYAQKIELAVPQEQSGLENAEELVHNLERWLVDTPDYKRWLMEEPPEMPDVPLAELPQELEDIVGELLDAEEEMTADVEDATSGWIDSLDKGAGWDAADGPISSMSARGVTGNQLPNNTEVGGRSGEGRTGRSQGQMVESAAEGKDGRQTPARLTATPFESGQVQDRSQQNPGGATGGGKISGFAGEGMRGPTPPPRLDQMKRLAGMQSEIRQDAERLNLHLRAYRVPSGDLDAAISQMRALETHAQTGSGGGIRRAFDATLESMRAVRTAISDERGSRLERGALSRPDAEALWSGLNDDMPPGYEEIVAAYYRRLAESPHEDAD